MTNLIELNSLVLATHNLNKVAGIAPLLQSFAPHLNISNAHTLGLPDIDETGADFAENALLKAQIVANATGQATLGDDSGFCVPALADFPGLYSARFVKNSGGQDQAVADLWQQVGQKPTPAFYVCHLCLVWPNVCQITAVGRVDGSLVYPARGNQGFGYDPYFVPNGYEHTFAELGPDITQKIGHRAQAVQKLAASLGWVSS